MMNRITRCCLQNGWSNDDLSRLFSIPPRIIARWERGELTPPAWAEAMIERRSAEEARRRREDRSKKGRPKGQGEKRWPTA